MGRPPFGGYQGYDRGGLHFREFEPWGGCQLMLNYRYRGFDESSNSTNVMSLRAALNDDKIFSNISDRIVLIGTHHHLTEPRDYHNSPYQFDNTNGQSGLPGVYIIAQQTSQILDAVLGGEGGRGIITTLPWWGDIIWVGSWSFGASLLFRKQTILIFIERNLMFPYVRFATRFLIVFTGLPITSYMLCTVCFANSIWLPLIPSILAVNTSLLVSASLELRQILDKNTDELPT
jgi:CHASE2 domain-containing sensor protein